MKDHISLRGDKDKWDKFVLKARERKERIWDLLEPAIEEYTNRND